MLQTHSLLSPQASIRTRFPNFLWKGMKRREAGFPSGCILCSDVLAVMVYENERPSQEEGFIMPFGCKNQSNKTLTDDPV